MPGKRKRKTGRARARGEPRLESRSAPLTRFRWLLLAGTGLALAGLAFWLVGRAGARAIDLSRHPRPNVLLVSIDTLRADHVGAYGSKTPTPVVDSLAREGVVFEKAVSQVPVTLPSHTCLLTGTYPIFNGVRDNGSFRLDASHETLAEAFRAAGYQTGAFVGSFALDSRFGLDRGFDVYDDYYGDTSEYNDFAISERPAETVLRAATKWLATVHDRPWFAFVHLYDPHAPYAPPPPFREQFRSDLYRGEIAYVDHALGAFLEELRRTYPPETTLIVLSSDHGEGLGEHGEKTHGMFAYDSTLHVPLILSWKRVLPAGRRVPSRVRSIDVAPTLLALASLPPVAAHQGSSLLPLITGRERGDRESYFEALSFNLNRNWAPLTGLYLGTKKYIDLPVPELYDLARDPAELANLAPESAKSSADMRDALRRLVERDSTESSRAIRRADVDEETIARLKTLGYLVSGRSDATASHYTAEDDPKNLVALSNELDSGVTANLRGKTDESVRIFREIIAKRPTFSIAYSNLAYVLRESGDLAEAVAVLRQAVEKGVANRTMLGRLGLYLQEAGKLDDSIAILESLTRDDPTYAEAFNYLGVSYARAGRTEDAVATLQKLLALDPSYASAYDNLGSVRLQEGRLAEAETRFRRALDLDPRLASAWNGLGVVYARTTRPIPAIDAWKHAVELDPRQYDTLYNLGKLLTELKRFDEAVPYLEQFADTAPPESYRSDIARVQGLLRELRSTRSGAGNAPTR